MTKEVVLVDGAADDRQVAEAWEVEAKAQTLDTLPAFLKKQYKNPHNYKTIAHAMVCGMYAAMQALDKTPRGGITGFQAGYVWWGLRKYLTHQTDGPAKVLDFGLMLNPRRSDTFAPTLHTRTWEWLRQEAREKLLRHGDVMEPGVRTHLEAIVNGQVPFGWSVNAKES